MRRFSFGAVNYAVLNQDAKGLRFGNRTVKGPDMVRDIKAVIEKKLPLFVVTDDLVERGIPPSQVVHGIEQVPRSAIAKLIESHDRILTW